MGNRHRATAEGHEPEIAGRKETRGERRTQGNQRTAAEGDKPGGQTGNRRKAPGNPEAVRSGPKPHGESPGIWGRTHLPCRGVCRGSGISPSHREAGSMCRRGGMPTWSPGSVVRSPR